MVFLYRVIDEQLYDPAIGRYRSYGLRCYQCGPSSRDLISSLSDVSADAGFVSYLADRFTYRQLYPIHLLDTIFDFLAAV